MIRRIYPTRFGQLHLRSHDGKGVPLVLLHMSPRSGAMWEEFQEKFERPTHAPDRLGYGFSDALPWALIAWTAVRAGNHRRAEGGRHAGPYRLVGDTYRLHRGH